MDDEEENDTNPEKSNGTEAEKSENGKKEMCLDHYVVLKMYPSVLVDLNRLNAPLYSIIIFQVANTLLDNYKQVTTVGC